MPLVFSLHGHYNVGHDGRYALCNYKTRWINQHEAETHHAALLRTVSENRSACSEHRKVKTRALSTVRLQRVLGVPML